MEGVFDRVDESVARHSSAVTTLYILIMDEMTIRFEWDQIKDRKNIVKHGVDFEDAGKVFSDPHVIIREDRVIEGEQRLHAIGYVDRVLLVVHTVREEGLGAIIRIISARKATSAERKLYEEIE